MVDSTTNGLTPMKASSEWVYFLQHLADPPTLTTYSSGAKTAADVCFSGILVCWLKFAQQLTSNIHLTMVCNPAMGHEDAGYDKIRFANQSQRVK